MYDLVTITHKFEDRNMLLNNEFSNLLNNCTYIYCMYIKYIRISEGFRT